MKKLTYFALALVFVGFTACKGEKTENTEDATTETPTTQVESGASEAVDNAAKVDEVLNQESEDELFGTDVDDAEVESATKK